MSMETKRDDEAKANRRDFLFVTTGAVGAVGVAAAIWPIINSLNPSADVLGQSSTEISLRPIEIGQRVTVKWRGQPVFIDRRTKSQIAAAVAADLADLRDPQKDSERVQNAEWLIVIGICTHLGCVPLGQQDGDPLGDWGGWFCPCHGSQYDTSGRVRKGPAPKNLIVPPYLLTAAGTVVIG